MVSRTHGEPCLHHCMVILAASDYEISRGKTDKQTDINATHVTAIGVVNYYTNLYYVP